MSSKDAIKQLINMSPYNAVFVAQAIDNIVKQIDESPKGSWENHFISEEFYRQFSEDWKKLMKNEINY